MTEILDFTLKKEQLEKLIELEKSEGYREMKLVSGSDIGSCPYCRGGGCYGSCQMQGC